MDGEKRKAHRQPLKYPAKIDLGDGNPPIPCLLIDVSDTGAKIVIETESDIPECFTLLLAGQNGRQRHCRVVWQEGKLFGAVFVKAPPVKDEGESRPNFTEMMRRA